MVPGKVAYRPDLPVTGVARRLPGHLAHAWHRGIAGPVAGLIRVAVAAFGARSTLQRLKAFQPMLLSLAALTVVFTVLFHLLMWHEGRDAENSWVTGAYWTLTTMSTLGYGDITFRSDLGRAFSMVVMFVGVVWFQIILVWFAIQYVFVPWARAQAGLTVPREAPADLQGHVVITAWDTIAEHLIGVLDRQRVPYLLIIADPSLALSLHDRGLRVMQGEPDDPAAWRAAGFERAALVATTLGETANANVIVTVRELSPSLPILALSRSDAGDEVLRLAGADQVMRLGTMLGEALARRITGPDAAAHHLASIAGLDVAEAPVAGTALAGRSLRDLALRRTTGVTVLCQWERGRIRSPAADAALDRRSILVLAGPPEAMAAFNAAFTVTGGAPRAVVIGAGRVGRSCLAALRRRGIAVSGIDCRPEAGSADPALTVGDARDHAVLRAAGLDAADAIVLTTHDDDLNIFLAVLCRRMRPEAQILARISAEKNVQTAMRAGADVVLSYASMGAGCVLDRLRGDHELVVSQGLHLARVPVPEKDAGQRLDQARVIRERAGRSWPSSAGTARMSLPRPTPSWPPAVSS